MHVHIIRSPLYHSDGTFFLFQFQYCPVYEEEKRRKQGNGKPLCTKTPKETFSLT